jgi:hypothetical protein
MLQEYVVMVELDDRNVVVVEAVMVVEMDKDDSGNQQLDVVVDEL